MDDVIAGVDAGEAARSGDGLPAFTELAGIGVDTPSADQSSSAGPVGHDPDPPLDQFAAIARQLRDEETELSTLDRAVAIAVELIDGCDHAGVTLIHDRGRRVESAVATSDVVSRCDAFEEELGEGPSLTSMRDHETISSPDLATESRWPEWSRRAHDELGVRSMLCFQLFTTKNSYGALNLYSETPRGFDDQDHTVGLALAAHVAVALAGARDIGHKDVALARRTTIGQAEGILMERFHLSPALAFAVLRKVSQSGNRKLYDVAGEVVDTHQP